MFPRNCVKALALISLVLPFAGCSSSEIDSVALTPTVVDFNGTGGSVQLTAIATINHGAHPATHKDVTSLVTWTTLFPDIAVVNENGMVTVTGLGVSLIKATVNGFTGDVSATSTVCATVPATSTAPSPLTCPVVTSAFSPRIRFSFAEGVRRLAAPGETVQFRAIGRSAQTGEQTEISRNLAWTSTNESVATVDKSGFVTAVAPGKATIMATLLNEDKPAVAVASVFTVTGR